MVGSGWAAGVVWAGAAASRGQRPEMRTGTAALVGKVAVVPGRVGGDAGAVKLNGEIWTARPYDDGEVLATGRRVHVVEIRGATALVSDID